MFVQFMKFIETHSGRNDNVSIFGQKSNPDHLKNGENQYGHPRH